MRLKSVQTLALIGATLIVGLSTIPWSWAQDPASNPFSESDLDYTAELEQLEHARRAVADTKRAAADLKRAAAEGRRVSRVRVEHDMMSKIRQAAEELRDADDDAQADAEAKLRQMLSQYFDQDMERRAADLRDIEKRVGQLQRQLEKRGNHKPEIIDLQVKVLVNEAEGLGFFSNTESAWTIFGPSRDHFRIEMPRFEVAPLAVPAVPPTPTDPYMPAEN